MSRIVRLMEQDLTGIVKRVIREYKENLNHNKIKNFIKNNFEIDLNGKIKEINRYSEIPKSFSEKYISLSTPKAFQDKIKFGQMYLIDVYKDKVINKKYLYQSGSDLMDQDGEFWSENQLMGLLGLNLMGLNINDLIDIYYESIYDI
jgi:hypothetical protein